MLRRDLFFALPATAMLITLFSCNSKRTAGGGADMPENISFNFHIRPILSDKCFACHGPDKNKREANLRLDDPNSAFGHLKENDKAFVIVKGNPEASELYKRITSDDPDYQMPVPDSHFELLNQKEIGLIRKWIEQGAQYEKHWAFVAPTRRPLPEISNDKWSRNEIDKFVLNKLGRVGLTPNEEAGKERLLKRVALDLTGLPPSIDMMDRFLADNSPEAYEKMVDELIASKAYGEKMSIQWLDLARYADSYGYQDDNIRTQWPWRDWLIHAFNINLPYDQFLTWQLAGDLLPGATKEQKLATAFLRNHKYTEEDGVVPEEYRVEYVIDKTKTFSKGVLGMTIECAQCHDHKYDPVSQKDYYRLFAFFNNSKEIGFEGIVVGSKPAKTPFITVKDDDIKNLMSFINKKDTGDMIVSVMEERDTVRKTFVLDRGVYDQPTKVEVRPSAPPSILQFDSASLPKSRLGLAKWTVSPGNPLTARVYVNHLWQEFFGRGIVKTAGDFGMQGELPSHPELLDWLAVDFREKGWNVKRLVKTLVMSAAYRQSTKVSDEKLRTDPENIYLARGPRLRLPAELIRDLVLSSSGMLVETIGGPSVKPYQPKGIWEASSSGRGALAVYRQDHSESLYRRGIYTFIKLTAPPPSMIIFDASNRDQCEVKRFSTNTPLQALVMMNDPMVLEASRVLAEKMIAKESAAGTNIQNAFRQIICRRPSDNEKKILTAYYEEQLMLFKNGKLDPKKILNSGEYKHIPNLDQAKTAALMKTINTIYNMEEAITKS